MPLRLQEAWKDLSATSYVLGVDLAKWAFLAQASVGQQADSTLGGGGWGGGLHRERAIVQREGQRWWGGTQPGPEGPGLETHMWVGFSCVPH